MYICIYIYIAWKLVYDFSFHDVLKTTILRQKMKDNEEIEKNRKMLSNER